jgi:hypothetical protein
MRIGLRSWSSSTGLWCGRPGSGLLGDLPPAGPFVREGSDGRSGVVSTDLPTDPAKRRGTQTTDRVGPAPSRYGREQQGSTALLLITYCGRCRKVLRCVPKGYEPRGCKCKVPQLTHPTKVWA